ncbi:MAG: exonuclease domain-containing protein [Pseudomonadota bacterium]
MSRAWLQWRRWRARKRVTDDAVSRLLSTALPAADAAIGDVELVALDMETNGLDTQNASVLSVGWVIVREGRVDLSSAERWLVSPDEEVGSSATIHGLTDTHLTDGRDIDEAMARVFEVMAGRVLVVHHAGLDKAILDRECCRLGGVPMHVPVIDTLALARVRAARQHHLGGPESLRLMDLRSEYRLPAYASHDCLVDALATAELLLAMLAHHGDGSDSRVWNVINA